MGMMQEHKTVKIEPSKLEHVHVLIKLEVNARICIRIVEIRFVVVV